MLFIITFCPKYLFYVVFYYNFAKNLINNNLKPKPRKGTNKMKTNNNNNRNENNAAKVAAIVENEGRIVAAIKKGNHATREIIPAADMFTEYAEFCEAIAALQIAGMVECREDGYYLTEKGEYLTEYDNEAEEAAAEIAAESETETPAEAADTTPATSEPATSDESKPSKAAEFAATVADFAAGTYLYTIKPRALQAWRATTKAARRAASFAALFMVRALFMAVGLVTGCASVGFAGAAAHSVAPETFAGALFVVVPSMIAAVGLWGVCWCWSVYHLPARLSDYLMHGQC